MSEIAKHKFLASLIQELHLQIKENSAKHRSGTSFNLNPDIVQKFLIACQQLGFPVSSCRGSNIVIEAFMKIIVDHARNQPQVTLNFYNNHSQTLIVHNHLTVEQQIEVSIAKSDLAETLEKFTTNPSKYWASKLRKQLSKAVKVAKTIRDPELTKLLKKAEEAWQQQERTPHVK